MKDMLELKFLESFQKIKFQNILQKNIGLKRPVLFEMSDEEYISIFQDNYIRVNVHKNDIIKHNSVHDISLQSIRDGQIIEVPDLMKKTPFVGIAGNIGVGKTTFMRF